MRVTRQSRHFCTSSSGTSISLLWPQVLLLLQLMSPSGKADFLSAEGDAEDWLWKAVRRGVAPAFAPSALRCSQPHQTILHASMLLFAPVCHHCRLVDKTPDTSKYKPNHAIPQKDHLIKQRRLLSAHYLPTEGGKKDSG